MKKLLLATLFGLLLFSCDDVNDSDISDKGAPEVYDSAVASYKSGKYAEALADFKKATENPGKGYSLGAYLGRGFSNLKVYQGAEDKAAVLADAKFSFNRALKIENDNENALFGEILIFGYEGGKLETIAAHAEKILKDNSFSHSLESGVSAKHVMYELGRAQLDAGKFEDALATLKKIDSAVTLSATDYVKIAQKYQEIAGTL